MAARGAALILREQIGNEATDALISMMNESNRSVAEEITRAIGDRFERRLTEDVSGVRIDMHKSFGDLRVEMHERLGELRVEMHEGFGRFRAEAHEGFGALRAEMHQGFGEVRAEMHQGLGEFRAEMHEGFGELRAAIADSRTDTFRWAFLFWVGQVGAVAGLLAYMK